MKDLHGVEPAYIITSMLEILQLKNFVIAKELSIDFQSGMSVITGETGAGKSLIVKSLDLLSGQQGQIKSFIQTKTWHLLRQPLLFQKSY